jgi:hypothetical protein
LIVCVVGSVFPVAAEEPLAKWSRVQELPTGSKVIVTVRGAGATAWRFTDADMTTIRVSDPRDSSKREEIRRADVLEVAVERSAARWGALVGGGAIIVAGVAQKASRDYFLVVGGLMAGLGALTGSNYTTHRVIYRAAP